MSTDHEQASDTLEMKLRKLEEERHQIKADAQSQVAKLEEKYGAQLQNLTQERDGLAKNNTELQHKYEIEVRQLEQERDQVATNAKIENFKLGNKVHDLESERDE